MSRKRSQKRSNVYDMQIAAQALIDNGYARAEGPKRKTWSRHDLKSIKPKTEAQRMMFEDFMSGQNIMAHGTAGTGKSFAAVYLALNELLAHDSQFEKIIIVRSVVPTREVGHLPGTLDEKIAIYERPYHGIFAELVGRESTYQDMKDAGLVQFESTSFVRSLTWDNAIVIIDEAQNMTWDELDGVVTRLGYGSRVVICGDSKHQQDLSKREKSGLHNCHQMATAMRSFSVVEFSPADIVRSEFVKRWIMTRDDLDL